MFHAYSDLDETTASNELGKQFRHGVRQTHLATKIFRSIYSHQQLTLQVYT